MSGPVPSHRRPKALPGRGHHGVFAGLLAWIVLVRMGMSTLDHLPNWAGRLLGFAACLAGIAAVLGWWSLREWRAARAMAGWVATGEWEPVPPRPWPWQGLVRWADKVTVLRAYGKRVDGFPVVTGRGRGRARC